jgi:uncharacterized protein (UPF0333 family)
MLVRSKKAQSILEYALLIAVVVAAILIMQVFVKRGFQGQLKDASGRMGEQFSATGTKTLQTSNMTPGDVQQIVEETATDGNFSNFVDSAVRVTDAGTITGDPSKSSYSVTKRAGGNQTVKSMSKTDNVEAEDFNASSDYSLGVSDYKL